MLFKRKYRNIKWVAMDIWCIDAYINYIQNMCIMQSGASGKAIQAMP